MELGVVMMIDWDGASRMHGSRASFQILQACFATLLSLKERKMA